MKDEIFIEIHYSNIKKYNQNISGDHFLTKREKNNSRIISVLSDGLGSGVKAKVLATLTSTMAANYIQNFKDIKKSAKTILQTLPVCNIRKISYATFTIVEIKNKDVRIIEYDNPDFILTLNDKIIDINKKNLTGILNNKRKYELKLSQFKAQYGNRIIFFSDGVSQAGMGTKKFPIGWGLESIKSFVSEIIKEQPEISAFNLSEKIIRMAQRLDQNKAKDDITCGVIFFRKPRKLLFISGPPIDKSKDREIAEHIKNFNGQIVICGGTTSKIVARELGKKIKFNLDLNNIDPEIPPTSSIDGIDLVTEGTITLGKTVEYLEKYSNFSNIKSNPVIKLINILLNNDKIYFLIGTKINEAHQDPNIPIELEIRRNIIKKMISLLEEKFLKETELKFI